MPANRQGSTSKTRRERRTVIRLEPVPAGRMKVVFVLLCAGLVGLVGRMAWLQIFQASELEARARVVQTQRTKPLGLRRGALSTLGSSSILQLSWRRADPHSRPHGGCCTPISGVGSLLGRAQQKDGRQLVGHQVG